jgi:polyisoprenoid-binding protein YceI
MRRLTYMPSYSIDPLHSIVEFSVRHMKVSTVKGRFLGIEGWLDIAESSPASSCVDVRIRAASVDTGVKERDDHLRSADFLNVALYPEIRFRSTKVQADDASGTNWKVYGDLTIRGKTRPITLNATLEGRMVDMDFKERIGFSAETLLNRRDFAIEWEGFMGRYIVGDEVRVSIDIQAWRPTGR